MSTGNRKHQKRSSDKESEWLAQNDNDNRRTSCHWQNVDAPGLPDNFVWLQQFMVEEIAEFFAELLEALNQSEQNKDWSFVSDLIEAWKATTNIKADPVVSDAVDQGLNELTKSGAYCAV